jgi:hypothetical protein
MADDTTSENINIRVATNLELVRDSERAATLFSRILTAVREQRAEDEQQPDKGRESAA